MINVTFRARRLSVWILVLQTYTNKTYKKNFSKSCKKPPTKLLFTLYIVNFKKNLSDCNFFYFFLQIQITFGETIPKRFNTWGLESYFILSYQMQSKSKGKVKKITI